MKKSSKPRKKKEKELEEWLVILFVLGIGFYLIWIGVTSLNFLTAAVGAAFAGGSILGTPELRVYVKLTFNYLSRGKSSNITQRDVSDSEVIGGDVHGDVIHGDVIINKGAEPLSTESRQSALKEEQTQPSTPPPGGMNLVDEAVVIQPKDTKEYKITLKKGQMVTIQAGADYPITVELINQTELLKAEKRGNKTIEVERYRNEVKNANIDFEAKRNGTWYVHIHNEQRKLPLEVGVIISVE